MDCCRCDNLFVHRSCRQMFFQVASRAIMNGNSLRLNVFAFHFDSYFMQKRNIVTLKEATLLCLKKIKIKTKIKASSAISLVNMTRAQNMMWKLPRRASLSISTARKTSENAVNYKIS